MASGIQMQKSPKHYPSFPPSPTPILSRRRYYDEGKEEQTTTQTSCFPSGGINDNREKNVEQQTIKGKEEESSHMQRCVCVCVASFASVKYCA